jgi:membrane associated rhomboid family serine protease
MNEEPARMTPWVVRLLAVNAVVLLLQQTIFTSSQLYGLVEFNSALAAQRPWTFVTYMFVHGGLWHLAANSLALFVFGPTVERRLGSPAFIVYYLYCGIGAAIASLLLHSLNLGHVPVAGEASGIVGASGAILGVAYAFSRMAPESQLMVFPIPVPIRARTLILMLAAFDVVGLLFLRDGLAHEAHLGGLLSGVFYFVLRGIARPAAPVPFSAPRRRVPVTSGGGPHKASSAGRAPAPLRQPEPPASNDAAEIDRVLDKISVLGLGSLSAEERQFLDDAARRRRDTEH